VNPADGLGAREIGKHRFAGNGGLFRHDQRGNARRQINVHAATEPNHTDSGSHLQLLIGRDFAEDAPGDQSCNLNAGDIATIGHRQSQ
jgi:hypothetical protein